MELPGEILALLRCPDCRSSIRLQDDTVECAGDPAHRFPVEGGRICFAQPPPGRYDDTYAARYAALWAYGYETIHSGQAESLYRTVASLASDVLRRRRHGEDPIVVDSGCGVGRALADCSGMTEDGWLIGLDSSPAMLQLADRIVRGSGEVVLDLSESGFGSLRVPSRSAKNVFLFRACATQAPLKDGAADLVLSMNTIDRLLEGPEWIIAECSRILRPGGTLILADPLNWQDSKLWERYSRPETIRSLIESCGLETATWFDDLPYRELVDVRGSVTEYRMLVVTAHKTEG
jgi:SAM-dependent methyltransferase